MMFCKEHPVTDVYEMSPCKLALKLRDTWCVFTISFEGVMGRLDMSMGLTSVASLSLGLSMSMSGGPALNHIARANPMLAHHRRESMQTLLSGRAPQRTSVGPPSRPSESFQNHVRGAVGAAGPAASGSGDASPAANVRFKKAAAIDNIPEETSEQQCLLNPADGEANNKPEDDPEAPAAAAAAGAGSAEKDPLLIPPIQPPPPIKRPTDGAEQTQAAAAGFQTLAGEESEPGMSAGAHRAPNPPQHLTPVAFHFENETEKEKSDSSSESNANLQANGPVISDSVSLHSNKSDSSQHSPQRNYAINPDLKVFIQVQFNFLTNSACCESSIVRI